MNKQKQDGCYRYNKAMKLKKTSGWVIAPTVYANGRDHLTGPDATLFFFIASRYTRLRIFTEVWTKHSFYLSFVNPSLVWRILWMLWSRFSLDFYEFIVVWFKRLCGYVSMMMMSHDTILFWSNVVNLHKKKYILSSWKHFT